MKNKYMPYLIAIVIVIVCFAVGISFSFFLPKVTGNDQASYNYYETIKSKVVVLDSHISSEGSLKYPGSNLISTFLVDNKADTTIKEYFVYFTSVVNEFTRQQDFSYTLTCSVYDSDKNYIGSCGDKELSRLPLKEEMVYRAENLQPNTFHEYTLVINYDMSGEDQSMDMNKKFSTIVNIELMKKSN